MDAMPRSRLRWLPLWLPEPWMCCIARRAEFDVDRERGLGEWREEELPAPAMAAATGEVAEVAALARGGV